MTDFIFTPATKKRAKARIAIDGPSGSGKTYTALIAATVLAEGGKIAVIDTERGSASLYSDRFKFDVLELNTFSPETYTRAIEAAERAGYAVIVIDSLSHAWEGEGGALDLVDKAAARIQGNTYAAWKDVTPMHRRMVDAMLQSPAHIVATMRSKMDYALEKDERTGKTVPRKIGLAPIQRQGMEYEFTLVGDMDIDHTLVISKSRCSALADAVEKKPGPEFFQKFLDWLNEGDDMPAAVKTAQTSHSSTPEKIIQPTKGNGGGGRPLSPEALREAVNKRAEKCSDKISEGARGLMVGQLNELFDGDENKRHQLTRYLFGTGSTKGMPGSFCNALLDWMKDFEMARREANAVIVMLDATNQPSLVG